MAVLPVHLPSRKKSFSGSIVLNIGEDEISERGRVEHSMCCGYRYLIRIRRNLILGRAHLWSLSRGQLQVNDIRSLKFEPIVKLA